MAIALVGVGVSTTIGALTKFNQFASAARNATGAYAVVMNQIDLIEAASAIPQDSTNNVLIRGTPASPGPPAIPAGPAIPTNGTQTLTTINGAPIAIYRDSVTNTIVPATALTTEVTPLIVGGVTMYRTKVTVAWQYQGKGPIWSGPPRNQWEYQYSMTTVRTSDQ